MTDTGPDDSADTEQRGRCLCGAVRFVARGKPNWIVHCHCESCRRATSAAFATYVGYPVGAVEWTGVAPQRYRSSPGVTRSFCGHCGSPVSFAGERWPGEIHLFAASFLDAARLAPQSHVHVEEQLPWARVDDGLPRIVKNSRAGAGMEDLHLTVRGLVQGVGFRDAMVRRATALGLEGWVRNRPDGSVEAVLRGNSQSREALRKWSERGPSTARVDHVGVRPASLEESAHVGPGFRRVMTG
jgi:acylphosphatase